MIPGQVTGAKVGVFTVPERVTDGRSCGYCGGALTGDPRPSTRFHKGECLHAARRLGWAAAKQTILGSLTPDEWRELIASAREERDHD